MKSLLIAFALIISTSAFAETGYFGAVHLTGNASSTWRSYPPGALNSMVCNVNGPDGFVSIRTCASSDCGIIRNIKRLAIVNIDTRYRQGAWVYVTNSYRLYSEDGDRLSSVKPLTNSGWVHQDYLCNYED